MSVFSTPCYFQLHLMERKKNSNLMKSFRQLKVFCTSILHRMDSNSPLAHFSCRKYMEKISKTPKSPKMDGFVFFSDSSAPNHSFLPTHGILHTWNHKSNQFQPWWPWQKFTKQGKTKRRAGPENDLRSRRKLRRSVPFYSELFFAQMDFLGDPIPAIC